MLFNNSEKQPISALLLALVRPGKVGTIPGAGFLLV